MASQLTRNSILPPPYRIGPPRGEAVATNHRQRILNIDETKENQLMKAEIRNQRRCYVMQQGRALSIFEALRWLFKRWKFRSIRITLLESNTTATAVPAIPPYKSSKRQTPRSQTCRRLLQSPAVLAALAVLLSMS